MLKYTKIYRESLVTINSDYVEKDLQAGDAYIIIEGALNDDEFLRFQ